MRENFVDVFPEVVRATLQQEFRLSIFVPAPGTSVATMCGLSGLACYFLQDSLVAASVLFAVLAYFGKTALYRALKEAFDPKFATALLFATMLVPSTVFWTAGIIKEAVAIVGLGPLVLGLKRLYEGSRAGVVPLLFGLVTVALVKPYILMATAGAAGTYLYWTQSVQRGRVEVRPMIFVLGGLVALGGLLAVGEVFPRYSLENLAQETSRLQAAGYANRPGSYYVIGDASSRGFLGHVLYAPAGLLTAMYRPLIFEATNPMMLVNAFETTGFALLTLWAMGRTSVNRAFKMLVGEPMLMYCAVFVVLLGVPVGLTSANLGTLSRYRTPLVPFQIALLLVVGSASPARSRDRSALLGAPKRAMARA